MAAQRRFGAGLALAVVIPAVLLLAACGADKADRSVGPEDPYVNERELPTPPTDASQVEWPQEQVVYYATDRAPLHPTPHWYLTRFLWAAVVLVAGWLLVRSGRKIVARPYQWRVTTLKWLVIVSVVVLTGWGAWESFRLRTLHDRVKLVYGGDRLHTQPKASLPLDLGVLTVSIPETHEPGLVERPSPFTGDLFEDPADHMVLTGVWRLDTKAFFERVRQKIGDDHDVLVFIHGYNSSFEASALRAAQIAWDLDFKGAPILYTWPSQGTIPGYLADAANVSWTVPHLHAFLKRLAEETDPAPIHLIAHSMGNRALTAALRRLRLEAESAGSDWDPFQQIVLAAPDIDADTFENDIAPAIRSATARVTLYASEKDKALLASRTFHGAPRAGEAGESLVVVPGIETVDVTKVTGSHTYIGDNDRVLDDLGRILEGEASERRAKHPYGDLHYWVLERPEDETDD